MLATSHSPYLDLGFHQTPPRIISEIKKTTPAWPRENMRPRISGELVCWLSTDPRWRVRRVTVRCGQLLVSPIPASSSPLNGRSTPGQECSPRLALRRLNLTPGPLPLSFALRRTWDAPPVLILQASTQREFDLWVRIIAIELIRQTPLDAIKYLDILTLTPQVHSTPKQEEKDCNHNSIHSQTPLETTTFRPKALFAKIDENKNYFQTLKPSDSSITTNFDPPKQFISLNIPNEVGKSDDDEQTVEILLKKCQNADSYVPVKEKLKLFESLCRLGRIVNSDDNFTNNNKYGQKRARSLHDLSNSECPVQCNTGVKQICKYFETKNDENKEQDSVKFNTIARGNRTSYGPVKTIISRKYSIQTKNF